MAQSASVKSFQEVYKTAYSHGLENIYALENVDLSTVRPLHSASEIAPPTFNLVRKGERLEDESRSLFDLGAGLESTLEHFVLKEPIQVLGLTRYIENSLLGQEKRLLRDLLDLEGSGFGRGHLDEIEQRLQEYIAGRDLKKTRFLDFNAWVRATVAELDKKKLVLALEPYGLQHLVTLSTSEGLELRRLTLEKKQEWREEIEASLHTDKKKQQIDQDFALVVKVLIKPWMDRRQGIATELELMERLQFLSENGCDCEPVLSFFSDQYFNGRFPLSSYLEPLGHKLFASEPWVADHYDLVVEKTLSYFYSPHITYPFDALTNFLEREFARSWTGFRPGFLSRSLKLCPQFFIHKNSAGILHLRLA